jgi:hypothetical protein
MFINCLKSVILSVFVPLWLNYTFQNGLKYSAFLVKYLMLLYAFTVPSPYSGGWGHLL